jgi:hypothetical protein
MRLEGRQNFGAHSIVGKQYIADREHDVVVHVVARAGKATPLYLSMRIPVYPMAGQTQIGIFTYRDIPAAGV